MSTIVASYPKASSTERAVTAADQLRAVAVKLGTVTSLLAVFLALAILLQIRGQVYQTGPTGYPDEPAHYVTGLMVRDYIASGFHSAPLQFAKDYYFHYPKVGLGHWPPLLYVIEAAWMLVFSDSLRAVLLLMAVLSAVLATITTLWVRKRCGWAAAIFAGALLVSLPVIQEQTGMVMAEGVLTLTSLLAALSFGRYTKTEAPADSARFGLFAFLAIMTKGNGWALLLMAPIALLFAGKLRLLWKRSFWSGIAITALALPWQVLTLNMAERGWIWHAGPTYTGLALSLLSVDLIRNMGIPLFAITLIGIAVMCVLPAWRRWPVSGEWATMLALIVSVVVFHSIVPSGIEDRKLVMCIPAVVAFAAAGGFAIQRQIALRISGNAAGFIWVLLALAFGATAFSIPIKEQSSLGDAATMLAQQPEFKNAAILVSGDGTFEGDLISEIAMRERRPAHVIVRATKLLADSDWNGLRYRLRYTSAPDMMRYLDSLPIDVVVLQPEANLPLLLHHGLLAEGLKQDQENWEPLDMGGMSSHSRPWIYQRRRFVPVDIAKLRADLGGIQPKLAP